jgi:polyisoprenyl-phosphate glycosyltransferase
MPLQPVGTPHRLTIVVTSYNSEQTITQFIHRLVAVTLATPLVTLHQLVVVDDCSTDCTFEVAESLVDTVSVLRVIKLSRNRGQQIAVSVGVSVSTGDLTLVMDDDGQNPVDEIPNLIRRCVETSSDVVIATSRHRRLGRRITSKLFWLTMRGSQLKGEPKSQLMMRLMNRRVVEAFKSYPESTRTVYGIVRDIGFKTEGVEVQIQPHISGRETSRYSFIDRLEVFIDAYLTSANRPFAFLFRISLASLISCLIFTLGALLSAVAAQSSRAILLSVAGLLWILVSGVILALSIVIRLLVLIYIEVRRRPLFHIVKDTGLLRGNSAGPI